MYQAPSCSLTSGTQLILFNPNLIHCPRISGLAHPRLVLADVLGDLVAVARQESGGGRRRRRGKGGLRRPRRRRSPHREAAPNGARRDGGLSAVLRRDHAHQAGDQAGRAAGLRPAVCAVAEGQDPDTAKVSSQTTVIGARMSHWKWRETKLQPSRARSGHQISCCFVSLHFLCDILATITVPVYKQITLR